MAEKTKREWRRQARLGHWHSEWEQRNLSRAEFRPEGRKEGSDYNQHYLDVNSPGDAEADFRARANEIMDNPAPTPHEQFMGSVVAGMIGDCLGRAVSSGEVTLTRREKERRGEVDPSLAGRSGYVSGFSKASLFMLEGLIRAHVSRRLEPSDNDPIPELQHALQRWLHSQKEPWEQAAGPYGQHLAQPDGWLITNGELFTHHSRDEISVAGARNFVATGVRAGLENRINNVDDPGAMLRSVPLAVWSNEPAEVFDAAVRMAALTHGNPTGYLPAGVLAVIVHQMLRGAEVNDAVAAGRELLGRYEGREHTDMALQKAMDLQNERLGSSMQFDVSFNYGRTAADVLGLGVYAVSITDYVRDSVLMAINTDGNSPAAGYVSGALAGALFGSRSILDDLVNPLELYELTRTLTQDALTEFSPSPPTEQSWFQRYPAW